MLYKKDKQNIARIKSEFLNSIDNNIRTYHIKNFKTIPELLNIEGIDKIGIFAEDEGDVYLIGLHDLQDEIRNVSVLIRKEVITYKLAVLQNNYYFIVKKEIEKFKIQGIKA